MRLIWIILALPSLPMLWELWADVRYFPELMRETGRLSVQLLILSLAITPLQRFTNPYPGTHSIMRWFVKNRRYFGVASFAYALLHVIFYIRHTAALYDVTFESIELRYATGWIAFLIMTLMTITSNNTSQRKLGPNWKTLQRWIYPATVAIFIHWLLFAFQTGDLILYAVAVLFVKSPQLLPRCASA